MASARTLTVVAGPNGAGKTTFVQENLLGIKKDNIFINADIFAHQLCPEDVSRVAIAAGKQFLEAVDRLTEEDTSFIIETTLSGKSLLNKLRSAQDKGFEIVLMFLWVHASELCDFRVKGRVAAGGHNIPIEDIQRRYTRGLKNFPAYREVANAHEVYLANEEPRLIYRQAGDASDIEDASLYEAFQEALVS